MQAIFDFIYRFRATFIFLILQVLCMLLIARYNNYQKTFLVNTSNFYTGKMNAWSNEATSYLYLREINKDLATENARLHELLLQSKQKQYAGIPAMVHPGIVDKYTLVPARVVNKTTTKLRNFLTIEKGSLDGIAKDMGVISATGIVGRVIEVSEHYAVISTILHNQSTTSVVIKLQKTGQEYLSYIQWNAKNAYSTKLKDIPVPIPASVGDTVRASGNNPFFPAGVLVGIVKHINPQNISTFHDIDVQLSTNFNALGYVYIVKNKLQSEQLAIEKDTLKKVVKK